MKKRPKIVVVMPAHQAEKTLTISFKRLPKKYIHQIILVDDYSTDNTFRIAKKLPITVFKNPINLGYGGNLKVCLTKALEAGADIIIEYHPDNQYDPENLPEFLEKVKNGYDFALGSRFIHPKEALKRHMPFTKFIANRCLTFIDQLILGIELTEFHSGFRMYTRKLLEAVPFLQNSDDYLFSFEIIVQAIFYKFRIAEIQVACDYHPKMHTANLRRSTIYAIGTFKTLLQYIMSKFLHKPQGPFFIVTQKVCPLCEQSVTRREHQVRDAVSGKKFNIYFCTICQIGFTHPQPQNLSPYYTKIYYSKLKTIIYRVLQYRRPAIVSKIISSGKILDIGCGDGNFGKQLDNQLYDYTGIETPFAKTTNPKIKLVGIEGLKEVPNSFDVVTFWESFEHLKDPRTALKKSHDVLKTTGYLIIECPRYNSWERIPFDSCWFHLDPPRHLFHYTQDGLSQKISEYGFKIVEAKTLYAPEYTPIGLAQSILYRISPKLNVFAQDYSKIRSIGVIILLLTLTIIVFPFSYIFYLAQGSPIQLVIAKKR